MFGEAVLATVIQHRFEYLLFAWLGCTFVRKADNLPPLLDLPEQQGSVGAAGVFEVLGMHERGRVLGASWEETLFPLCSLLTLHGLAGQERCSKMGDNSLLNRLFNRNPKDE